MTQAVTQRANRDGSPCPDWCTTDHDQVLVPERDGRPAILFSVHAAQLSRGGRPGAPMAWVILDGAGDPGVHVSCARDVPLMDAAMAEAVACVLEAARGLCPEHVMDLAGEIREAAAIARAARAGR